MAITESKVETELKLRLSTKSVRALLECPSLSATRDAGAATTVKLRTIYFDSPDRTLWQAGVALRLRRVGRRWIQSIKLTSSEHAGLHRHGELETVVPGATPALDELPDTIRTLIEDHRADLAPVFETEVQRTLVPVALGDGQMIELAIDRGRIKAKGESEALCEAELEIKEGSAARVFEFALELHRSVSFVLEHRTKAARGYALADAQAPRPRMAQGLVLTPDMPANQALALAAGDGLRQMGANEAIARLGEDIEGVHQMRVGLRRLKVAFTLATNVRSDFATGGLSTELSWIGDVLGRARDLDVFIDETLEPLRAKLTPAREIDQLIDQATALRRKAYDTLRACLDSPRYTDLQLRIGAWVAALSEHATDQPAFPPLSEVAPPLLSKRRRQIRRFVRDHGWQTKSELHEFRLHAKKLRYAATFFAPLYPRKRTKTFIGHLAQLQDALGLAHDGEVARALLAELGTRPTIDAPPAQAWRQADSLIEGWHLARASHLAQQIEEAWHALDEAKRFW